MKLPPDITKATIIKLLETPDHGKEETCDICLEDSYLSLHNSMAPQVELAGKLTAGTTISADIFHELIKAKLGSFLCHKCSFKCCIHCKLRIARHKTRIDLENMCGVYSDITIRCPGCRNSVTEQMNLGYFGYYKNCILHDPSEDEWRKWLDIIFATLLQNA